jgi:hypothetical protein
VNAQSTRALYEKLLVAHPGGQPIYIVCDNARYYRNRELAEWLQDKPLVQVFLSPYSPNLNLIERLWRFLRQKLITPVFIAPKARFAKRYSASSTGSKSLGTTSRPYLPSTSNSSRHRPLCDESSNQIVIPSTSRVAITILSNP